MRLEILSEEAKAIVPLLSPQVDVVYQTRRVNLGELRLARQGGVTRRLIHTG